MGFLANGQQLVNRAAGGLVACLLLLPLPALAYTISSWSFSQSGTAFLSEQGGDHKELNFNSPHNGQAGEFATGTSTVTATAGEMLNAHLDLTGLNITRGGLKVTITLGNGNSQTATFLGPNTNPMADFSLALSAGTEAIKVTFQFSNNAAFTYTASTPTNLQFH